MEEPQQLIVSLENFGPFKNAEIELKPLTIFIGKNSSGKSMISYMLWLLASTFPDFDIWAQYLEEVGAPSIAEKIVSKIKDGEDFSELFKSFLEKFIETFPYAIGEPLNEAIENTFGTLENVIYGESKEARMTIKGPSATIEVSIPSEGSEVFVRFLKFDHSILNRVRIAFEAPKTSTAIKVYFDDEEIVEEHVGDTESLIGVAFRVFGEILVKSLGFFFIGEENACLFVDGRAGITRTLLKPWIDLSIAKGILRQDLHYTRLCYRIARDLADGYINLDFLKPLLKELGIEEVEPVREKGFYTLYVKSWTGIEEPFESAPSGVRESLMMALALLLVEERRFTWIFIEEPEAHLHPKAQRALATLLSKKLSKSFSYIVLNTHSDYLIYAINNLIALSRYKKDDLIKLGYGEDDVIFPSQVSAYLLKSDTKKRCSEIRKLKVDELGIDEEEFTRILEELGGERSRIMHGI